MPDSGAWLSHKIKAARFAIAMERLADALFWPLMAVGLAVFFILTGWVAELGAMGRALFWLAALGLVAAGLWPGRQFRFPGEAEAVARLEQESGLSFRPLTALRDRLASGELGLWAAHQARMAQQAAHVRWPRPRFSFGARDPHALRNGLMLLLIVAAALRGGDGLLIASLPQISSSSQSLQVDGWITPPAYTGKPPVLLAKGTAIQAAEPIAVPVGSALLVRIAGARHPQLAFGPDDAQEPLAFAAASASQEARFEIREDGVLTLSDGWSALGNWSLQVIPDLPPQAKLPQVAQVNKAGSLILPYEIADDYGVKNLVLHFALADVQEGGEGLEGNGAFLAEAPQIAVALASVNPREATGKASADLTKHPWAGLYVEAWIEVRDGAGQEGLSNRLVLKLPERNFNNPMSQALAEQRKLLLRDTENVPRVVAALDALAVWPQDVLPTSAHYLQLRSITRKIYRAADYAAVAAAGDDLWNLAVALEGGNLANARTSLDAARKALEEAIAQGASPEEISRLVQELKAAMETYLSAMADAARRGELGSLPSDGKPRRQVTPQELSKMLDEMQALSKQGAADKALDMLAELDQILKNLQMDGAQAGGNPDASLLRDFSKLMRGQQLLMDRTFRLPQDGAENGQGLAGEQGDLGQGLAALMDRLGEQGMAVPEGLNRAQRQMQGAGEALQAPDRNSALHRQQQALNGLRESFDEVARQMMGDGETIPGQPSQQGSAGAQDPLGRPRASQGSPMDGQENMVPGEAPAQIARRILDELRKRSGQMGLEPVERDYLERLLRGLY
jgi:uncharacterized protein (TIGR02302 family)